MAKERNSRIEVLRIIAMFLIVIGHCRPISNAIWTSPFYQVGTYTMDPQEFILSLLSYAGAFGNGIFLIIACYFLVDQDDVKPLKIVNIMSDGWFIAAFVLLIFELFSVSVPWKMVIQSLLPTTYGMNWYAGCYILLYLVHPYLNMIIHRLTRRQHLCINVFLFFLYFVAYFLLPSASVYYNSLVGFISVYFLVSYTKKFMSEFFSAKRCGLLLAFSAAALFLAILCMNYLGYRFGISAGGISYFSYFNCAPVFLMCLSVFYLVKNLPGGGYKSIHQLVFVDFTPCLYDS